MDQYRQLSLKNRLPKVSLSLKQRIEKIVTDQSMQLINYCEKIRQSFSLHEIILDQHGTILTWNNSLGRLFGYKPEEIIGKKFNSLNLPDLHLQNTAQRLMVAAQINGESIYVGQFVKGDGCVFYGTLRLIAIRKNFKEILGYVLYCKESIKTK